MRPLLEVPCKWCGVQTKMLATKECNGCWEMRSRMQANLPLAKKIITSLEHIQRKKENEKIVDKYKDAVDDAGPGADQNKINERMGV